MYPYMFDRVIMALEEVGERFNCTFPKRRPRI